jgi:hypothetical protein
MHWEHVGEQIGNLGNILGRDCYVGEQIGNLGNILGRD